jgi:hypothetical protein
METFKEEIDSILKEISNMLVKKRHDYGKSFDESWKLFGIQSAVIRLYDKFMRLINLTSVKERSTQYTKPIYESIEDTFKDIIGYCILSLRMLT